MQTDLETACGSEPWFVCEKVLDWTGNIDAARIASWFIDRPIRILLILAVAWFASRVVRRSITRFVERLTAPDHIEESAEELIAVDVPTGGADEDLNFVERSVDLLFDFGDQQVRARQRALTLGAVLRSITSVFIWVIAGLLILGELNISLAPLIASAGIAGVAIGFGAQSLVKDFLAGIFFIVEDQFGVGDIIDVGDAVGTVESVTLRATRLRDAAGVLWIIPNGTIRLVGNTSQLWSKSLLDIEVAYDTDIDFATKTIKGVLDELWKQNLPDATIIEEPEVLGVQSFGADAIVIRAIIKTEPAEQFTVARTARARLKDAFDKAGIEIPFPQRTVWIRHEEPTDSSPFDQ